MPSDELENLLASENSMLNYEDALWNFEKKLSKRVEKNRLELISIMENMHKGNQKDKTYENVHERLVEVSQATKNWQT